MSAEVTPIGEALQRLVAKTASGKLAAKSKTVLVPLNVGFAVPSGAEAAVHAACAFSEIAGDEDVLLKIDFANAF